MTDTVNKQREIEKTIRNRSRKEKSVEVVLLVCAMVSVVSVLFISFFIFQRGLPLFKTVGVGEFLFGTDWAPTREGNPQFGILPFILV